MQTQSPKPEDFKDDQQAPTDKEDKKLDHLAEDAAKQAGKTQQRYDKDHNIFTK
jgi:hypothetical protein